MARAEADPVFALFLEANGLAASGREPYRTLVPQLVEVWITWAAEYVHGTPTQRRTEAETSIATPRWPAPAPSDGWRCRSRPRRQEAWHHPATVTGEHTDVTSVGPSNGEEDRDEPAHR